MAVTINHVFKCDVCGLTITQCLANEDFPAEPGFLETKILPRQWTFVGRRLVCHRHDIAVGNRGSNAMVLFRKGYTDDEAGFHPEDVKRFEEPPPPRLCASTGMETEQDEDPAAVAAET